MSEAQAAAHAALLASLQSRIVRQASDEPEDWYERDRPLSPSEMVYLLSGEA